MTPQVKPQCLGRMGFPRSHLWGSSESGGCTSRAQSRPTLMLRQVLSSALTVALSGSCNRDVLRLLLQFPEDGKSESAARELCGLPRAQVFSVIVVLARNLDLRNFVYKVRGRRVLAWFGQREGPVWVHQGQQGRCRLHSLGLSPCPLGTTSGWGSRSQGLLRRLSGVLAVRPVRTFGAALVAVIVLSGKDQ